MRSIEVGARPEATERIWNDEGIDVTPARSAVNAAVTSGHRRGTDWVGRRGHGRMWHSMPPSSPARSSRLRPRSAPLHVWKFGGASLADATAVATAASRIAAYRGPLVVVASALAGITDVLLDAADHAVAGRAKAAAAAVGTVRQRHQRVATAVVRPAPARRAAMAAIARLGARVRGDPRRRRHPAAPVAADARSDRRPRRAALGDPAGGGDRPPRRLRRRARGGRHRRPLRRRQPAACPDDAARQAGDHAASSPPAGAGRAWLHRPGARRQRRHARPRRVRPDGHAARPGAGRRDACRCGRTCPASSPRTPGWCPTRG